MVKSGNRFVKPYTKNENLTMWEKEIFLLCCMKQEIPCMLMGKIPERGGFLPRCFSTYAVSFNQYQPYTVPAYAAIE